MARVGKILVNALALLLLSTSARAAGVPERVLTHLDHQARSVRGDSRALKRRFDKLPISDGDNERMAWSKVYWGLKKIDRLVGKAQAQTDKAREGEVLFPRFHAWRSERLWDKASIQLNKLTGKVTWLEERNSLAKGVK
jgi:hypothetical protein